MPLPPSEAERRLVLQGREHVVAEARHEEPLDQVGGQLPAAAVAEQDRGRSATAAAGRCRGDGRSRARLDHRRRPRPLTDGDPAPRTGRSRPSRSPPGAGRRRSRPRRPLPTTPSSPPAASAACTLAERGAVVRLLQPLEDLPADAHGRFLRLDVVDLEEPLGVVVAVLGAQPVAALGDQARCRATCGRRPRRRPRSAAATRGLPSRPTARPYWFSTSARPASSCRTVR